MDRDAVLYLFLGEFDNLASPPTPADVRSRLESFLAGPFTHLRPEVEAIYNEALRRLETRVGAARIMVNEQGHEEWLSRANRSQWLYWDRLKRYLLTRRHFPIAVMNELDRSTDLALGWLESPERRGVWDRRGLVFGHVQSGKTTHYTAIAAKALDAGYQIVVVLAGIHNSLRSQTHERLDHFLIGRDSAQFVEQARRGVAGAARMIGVGEFTQQMALKLPPLVITFTSSAQNGDFNRTVASQIGMELGRGTRLVLVVKKNAKILDNLLQWLASHAAIESGRISAPALVIDDEADHASINISEDPDEPARINGLIRRLLVLFQRVGFVGYTATPFANIFIPLGDDQPEYGRDLFPEDFILNLKAPDDYVGPAVVFGNPGDESAGIPPSAPLPMFVSSDDAAGWMPHGHKTDFDPAGLPHSLQEALRLFVLICAARRARGQVDVHNSMLIHVTRFVKVQGRVRDLVGEEVDVLGRSILNGDPALLNRLEQEFSAIWEERVAKPHTQFYDRLPKQVPSLPAWPSVWAEVPAVFDRLRVMKVNGTAKDALEYTRNPQGISVVAIGGDKLSRGLTLEGLSVSYFLRASKLYDTLMQMGRWFGYRPGYLDLCRVYTTTPLRSIFREMTLAVEELRNELDAMVDAGMKPKDYGLRMRTPSEGLLLTGAQRFRSGTEVAVRFAGELVQARGLPRQGKKLAANRSAVRSLIQGLPAPARTDGRGVGTAHYFWRGVNANTVLGFLAKYDAPCTSCFCSQSRGLRAYIEQQVERDELTQWTVVLVAKRRVGGSVIDLGGLDVPTVRRSRDEDVETPEDTFLTRAVVGSADETLDLTPDEYRAAMEETRRSVEPGTDVRLPKREHARGARPPDRGLLLLYLLDGMDETGTAVATEDGDFNPAVAVSFPERLSGGSVSYMVNDVWSRLYKLDEDWDDNTDVANSSMG